MAIINFHPIESNPEKINTCKSVIQWLISNISNRNFSVFDCLRPNLGDISRKPDELNVCQEVDVYLLPAGGAAAAPFTSVFGLANVQLTPKPKALGNVNRNQESPNNSLEDRRNIPRPNQRIVHVVGQVKSVPDVIAQEYAEYVNNVETRYGYYCVGVNQLAISDIKDADTPIEDIQGAGAGVYSPGKSPNNSPPDIQVGDEIGKDVFGVYQSTDALGQSIQAPNEGRLELIGAIVASDQGFFRSDDSQVDFSSNFSVGDTVSITDVFILVDLFPVAIGASTSLVTGVTSNTITFEISGDDSWKAIPGEQFILDSDDNNPAITKVQSLEVGPFRITTIKIDRLLVNCFSQNGMYKEDSDGRQIASVDYEVSVQLLDDFGNPLGAPIVQRSVIQGSDSNEKGATTEFLLNTPSFVSYSIKRLTPKDFEFEGAVVDDIKLKSVFGLFNIDKTDFGNVTTIQTKRISSQQATEIRDPELNCIATEMVQKYFGNGVFDSELTENTEAMQSLISVALNPFIGRRVESEIDLDLLLSTQQSIDSYFSTLEAGRCCYSFDSTSTTAQETFDTIARAAFSFVYREGRVLKSWFERPQAFPQMVFTHRSKEPASETWTRIFTQDNDGVELKYIDDKTYRQETISIPEDQVLTNPDRVEIPGIKGVNQAAWHAKRLNAKRLYQNVTVDFSSTQEGKFVRPGQMISVVKGSRVGTFDGEVVSVNGFDITLSQPVSFVDGDDHFVILKNRDGSTESIQCLEGINERSVILLSMPIQAIYTGRDAKRTEFSFGNESRLTAQEMIPVEIIPTGKQYVRIKSQNYSDRYYDGDSSTVANRQFSEDYNFDFG